MSPPVATAPPLESTVLDKSPSPKQPHADALEDYDGHYRFAPIEEAQVARAMIKR